MADDIADLIDHFDRWSREWNGRGADQAREAVIEFLSEWRGLPGDWLEEVSDQFFQQVVDRGLFLDDWQPGITGDIQRLHLANQTIWHLEDEARRDDVNDVRIVEIKRGIDAVNQKRNDQMERLDEWVIKQTEAPVSDDALPVHSEPPGLIFDRLSILSLKLFYYGSREMSDQQRRVREQRDDLSQALIRLWDRLENNEIRVKIYRQFKTYNRRETNPALRNES